MRTAAALTRSLWAAALALLLGLWLLSPAGFMPAFDHGAVTIVVCPDAASQAVAGHHHHDGRQEKLHQPCPYAAASALGLPIADLPLPVALLAIGLALLLGRAFLFVERSRARERPPLRAPPASRLS